MHSQPPKSPLSGGLWQLRALVNVYLFLEFTIYILFGSVRPISSTIKAIVLMVMGRLIVRSGSIVKHFRKGRVKR